MKLSNKNIQLKEFSHHYHNELAQNKYKLKALCSPFPLPSNLPVSLFGKIAVILFPFWEFEVICHTTGKFLDSGNSIYPAQSGSYIIN